jgi:hypothetical protein
MRNPGRGAAYLKYLGPDPAEAKADRRMTMTSSLSGAAFGG